MAQPLLHDSVWLNQQKFEQAEAHYQSSLAGTVGQTKQVGSSLVNDIAQARQEISILLNNPASSGSGKCGAVVRIESLEKENQDLRKVTGDLQAMVLKLDARVTALEKGGSGSSQAAVSTPSKAEDDDDIDLFGDSDDDEETEAEIKEREAKVAAYKARKAGKPAVIAKSNIILDVKPWDDETDMKELEKKVRTVQTDGLKWTSSKLVPVGYGINKLQIMCVVEDDKVGTDFLEEGITAFEDFVQSVDIVAFNKI